MSRIPTALVGVSGFGQVHYRDLLDGHARGVLAPVAACVINQQEEAGKCAALRDLGTALYDDYHAMLADWHGRIGLLQLPIGIPLHRPMAEAGLAAGAHLLLEKPVAGCLADAEAIRRARDAAGRRVIVGFQRMFDPVLWDLKQRLLAGVIGELRSLTGYGLWPRTHAYYHRNAWAGRLSVDGVPVRDSPIQNALAHEVLMLLFLGGRSLSATAVPVRCEAELYRAHDIEGPDTCAWRVTTDDDLRIGFCGSHACRTERGPVLRIDGTDGVVEWIRGGGADDRYRIRWHDGREEGPRSATAPAALRRTIIDQTAAAIRGEDHRACDLDQALAHTRLLEAVHRASDVRSIGPEHWTTVGIGDDAHRAIHDIDELADTHLATGALFAEAGAAWASTPGTATMQR